MKASYSASWKKSSESGSNRFHKLYFSQRSTVGSGSVLTAGIIEYDCEKRERPMLKNFRRRLKQQLGRFSKVTDARKIESFSGRGYCRKKGYCVDDDDG
jgi:hypothetical protein